MDGMRFVVSWHIHGAVADDAIIRYKLPCNATLVQVDTCGTADSTAALKIGTLLPTSDDDGLITSFTPGKAATFVTRDRGDFSGALNADTAECPHLVKDTVLLLTWVHNAGDTDSDVDIALTFLEG